MTVERGDRVTIEYVGRFEDGTVFDTSRFEVAREHGLPEAMGSDESDYTPLTFTVGSESVIEGLDEAVVGMAVGGTETVTVPPEKAYGPFEADRVREYDVETFESMVGQPPDIGLHVEAENGLHGDVTAVREDHVEVDFNHELAGKTLVFDVEVLAVS